MWVWDGGPAETSAPRRHRRRTLAPRLSRTELALVALGTAMYLAAFTWLLPVSPAACVWAGVVLALALAAVAR